MSIILLFRGYGRLYEAPILAFPNFQKEFILKTDASDLAVGFCLKQCDKNSVEHVIAYGTIFDPN
jgi:hypothetical protein